MNAATQPKIATKPTVPPGFRLNAEGNLVAEANIKPIELARDQVVYDIATLAATRAKDLAAFKAKAMDEIAALVELSAGQYGVKLGGRKGNVTLFSFDGRYKVVRSMQDQQVFDERLQAAKALIDECLRDWTKDAHINIRAIIDRAFEVDKQGNLSVSRILTLRRVQIDDVRWQNAMQAISDSLQVITTKSYIRVYERAESGEYLPLALDVASA